MTRLVPFTILFALYIWFVSPASAQDVLWDDPVQLTDDDSVVAFSAISVDSQGGVHIFWVHLPDSTEPTNVLFYRYRSQIGGGWSEPNDIFVGSDSETFSLPYVVIDQFNRLHLIWNGQQGIYYSSAPAAAAFDASSWTQPTLVVSSGQLGRSAMVVGQDRSLHVTYARRQPGTNVMYVRSEDNGVNWSEPVPLSDLLSVDEQTPDFATIAQDRQGNLHVVWSESYPPEFIGREVRYTQSMDGGINWTSPRSLSGLNDSWTSNPNILADSNDRLHVMWAGCGDPVARCYGSSADHGSSWSSFVRPYSFLVGSSGLDAMAADPFGNLFWASSLRYPQAFYFSTLTGGAWENPPQALITEQAYGLLGSAHFPEMAVGLGNQLHILLVESDRGPLWYLHGQTSYPAIAPVAPTIPTLEATSTTEPLTQKTAFTPTPAPPVSIDTSPAQAEGIFSPLMWSGLSVIVFLIMLGFTFARSRR